MTYENMERLYTSAENLEEAETYWAAMYKMYRLGMIANARWDMFCIKYMNICPWEKKEMSITDKGALVAKNREAAVEAGALIKNGASYEEATNTVFEKYFGEEKTAMEIETGIDEAKEEKINKEIPKEYMWSGTIDKPGFRKTSPVGKEIGRKRLEDIPCPCCGEKSLFNAMYGEFGFSETYVVECKHCGWVCPIKIEDCGEAITEFKYWLEAFILLGRPKDKLKEDVTLMFYPPEWRKQIEENEYK